MTKAYYKDNMMILRQLCKNYSKYMPGMTIFPAHTTVGNAKLWARHRDGSRTPLAEGKISQLSAIVDWEIGKAEGRLRNAA
jgi:hypothetical protein